MTPAPIKNPDPKKQAWIRRQPCMVAGMGDHVCRMPVQCCHYKHGSNKDDRLCFPGCDQLHSEHHQSTKGEKWINLHYNINLLGMCRWYHNEYLRDTQFMPSELDLFEPPPPPTGPPAEIPTKEANSYGKYIDWMRTEDGRRVFKIMVEMTRDAAAAGAKRVSTRTLAGRIRDTYKIPVNNSYTGWLADDIVLAHPQYKPIIERRERKKAKT